MALAVVEIIIGDSHGNTRGDFEKKIEGSCYVVNRPVLSLSHTASL